MKYGSGDPFSRDKCQRFPTWLSMNRDTAIEVVPGGGAKLHEVLQSAACQSSKSWVLRTVEARRSSSEGRAREARSSPENLTVLPETLCLATSGSRELSLDLTPVSSQLDGRQLRRQAQRAQRPIEGHGEDARLPRQEQPGYRDGILGRLRRYLEQRELATELGGARQHHARDARITLSDLLDSSNLVAGDVRH